MSEMIVKFHCDERGIARSWDEVGELIRCKDCKHWMNEHLCKALSRYGTFETSEDFYCGYAERKVEK